MKRAAGTQVVKGNVYGRFWLGGAARESVPLSGVKAGDADGIKRRCEAIVDATEQLVACGRPDKARDIAKQLGVATNQKRVDLIIKAAKTLSVTLGATGGGVTIQQFGDQWASGSLHLRYPDHVKKKKSAQDDAEILKAYIYPVMGGMPVRAVTDAECERVMGLIPAKLSPARRRHVAQVMSRLFNIAVYPAKLIKASPLPKGFLPKLGPGKAKQYLYPDEDTKLLACAVVPLLERLVYGFLDREGLRLSEAVKLEWTDIDLVRGALKLDENKTDDPRSWALDPGVVRALTIWKSRNPSSRGPFVDVVENHAAKTFREHLRLAGIDRPELFARTEARYPIRAHDLRATFVTVSLANGKSETWVADRTGHGSTLMINRYRRAARTLAELNVGQMRPLDEAIVWREDQKTTSQPDSVNGAGVEKTRGLKNKLRGPFGIRTRTLFRAADFKSRAESPDDALEPEKRPVGNEETPDGRSFSDGLRVLTADLGEIRRGWSAFEYAIESMVEDGVAQ